MKPRIMLIHPSFYIYGGAERQIIELSNYLSNQNYLITIFTTGAINEFKKNLKDSRLIEAGNLNNLLNLIRIFAPKFEIINSHNHPAEYMLYPRRNKHIWQCNEPPEVVLRGGRLPFQEIQRVKTSVSKAVVISSFDKIRFENIYGFSPVVNYPGVRYDYFSKSIEIKKDKDQIILLQPGYITWTKNQEKTIEVLAEVKKFYKNVKLILAGWDKDPYKEKIIEIAKKLKVLDDITFTGYIDSDEKFRELYNKCDVSLNPVKTQGGYATIFESISSGCPTILSDTFISSDIVSEHGLGIVSKEEDFVDVTLRTLENLDKIKDQTLKNRTWIKNNLSWDNFGKKYEEIIETLI